MSEARRFEDVDDEVDGPGVLRRGDSSTVNEFWDPALLKSASGNVVEALSFGMVIHAHQEIWSAIARCC